MKTCTSCLDGLPTSEFHKRAATRKDGLAPTCRSCSARRREALRRAYREDPNRPLPDEKTCPSCKVTKPRSEFGKVRVTKDGLGYWCKPCTTEKQRVASLKSKYGISAEDYDRLLAQQGGVCGICGAAPGARALAVDHDHDCCPGKKSCGTCIRGLLCSLCNTGIGSLRDSPDLLRSAVGYLERGGTWGAK